jgi:predicted AAA+ superfamily ATPase
MIQRSVEKDLARLANQYPVVTIVGPRQSGKTTISRKVFSTYKYISLENVDERERAIRDPKAFLKTIGDYVILDEVQRAPSLLSYIQTRVDEVKQNGLYILTGSHQFELMESLSQSLAGRTAIVKLLPLSIAELYQHEGNYLPLDDYLFNGFYPRIYDQKLNANEAYAFYVSTYLERDIRNLINLKDFLLFERFLKVCASRTGQILNLSSIGNECGLSHNTVNAWLSLLEASFVIFRLPPHFKNFSKRIIKSPKLYFYDVGLVSFLLGIQNRDQWNQHPLKGAVFETLVVGELIKKRFNQIKGNNLFYFRDNVGHEVDVLIDEGTHCTPLEIKLGETIHTDFFKGVKYYTALQGDVNSKSIVVYGGDEDFETEGVDIVSYKRIDKY